MVKHFRDPIATAAAEGMCPQKYLVYLDTVSPPATRSRCSRPRVLIAL